MASKLEVLWRHRHAARPAWASVRRVLPAGTADVRIGGTDVRASSNSSIDSAAHPAQEPISDGHDPARVNSWQPAPSGPGRTGDMTSSSHLRTAFSRQQGRSITATSELQEAALSSVREDVEAKLAMEPEQEQPAKLEISGEARAMFYNVYREIVGLVGGEEDLAPPKEIVWLNGAPGAGKGANTPFILKTRGFEARAIQVSDLLSDNAEVTAVMQSGGLVSDSMVLRLVLESSDNGDEGISGAVVDGFPRTTLQVDFIKLLHDQLMALHDRFLNTPMEHRFPRPIFRIAVLYVEEEESVRRQLGRGRAAIAHNQRVSNSGLGDLTEVRPTDLCEKSARRRYRIFKQHYDTLLRLKAFFPFHLIDGMGTLAECREQIEKELQYQSALELDATTFHAISHIPLATDIAMQARPGMVARLDGYQAHDPAVFKEVIDAIQTEVIPIIRRSALAGIALFNTENALFLNNPEAPEMLADILSERGYSVTWQTRTREIPIRFDPETFEIKCMRKTSMQFRIKFERPQLRSGYAMGHTAGLPPARVPQQLASVPAPQSLLEASSPNDEWKEAQVKGDKAVCQRVRSDGTPACYSRGDGTCESVEEFGDSVNRIAQNEATEGVAIPGLPHHGRILRESNCPPLPEWATAVGRKAEA